MYPTPKDDDLRRQALDTIRYLNQQTHDEFGDPETLTRIAQYEMAFRSKWPCPTLWISKKSRIMFMSSTVQNQARRVSPLTAYWPVDWLSRSALRTAVRLGLGLTWSSKFRGVKRWLPRQVPRGRQAYGRLITDSNEEASSRTP